MIEQLKAGDRNAFRQCVENYQDMVLNLCYHFVRDKNDAQELAQDVFVELYRSVAGYREEASLSTWLYRIGVNKSLDLLRKKKRKKRFANLISFFLPDDTEREFPDNRYCADTLLEQKERQNILREAIHSLPENQRTAFILSKYDSLSNEAIAEILSTTISSVESLLHRAKMNLRKRLEHDFKNFD